MIRLKLSGEDRARLGAPEVIEFDEGRLLLSEARKLQKATGFHPADFVEALKRSDINAIAGVIWLGLLRAGVEVDFDELDFDLSAFEEVPEQAGKGPADEPASPITSTT